MQVMWPLARKAGGLLPLPLLISGLLSLALFGLLSSNCSHGVNQLDITPGRPLSSRSFSRTASPASLVLLSARSAAYCVLSPQLNPRSKPHGGCQIVLNQRPNLVADPGLQSTNERSKLILDTHVLDAAPDLAELLNVARDTSSLF